MARATNAKASGYIFGQLAKTFPAEEYETVDTTIRMS